MTEKQEKNANASAVLTFEEGLKRLKEIDQQMEKEERLDKSLALYKEAKELSHKLQKLLDQAELEITDLEGDPVSVQIDKENEE